MQFNEYEACLSTLDKHFNRKRNKFFERHRLRGMRQNDQEAVEQFVGRLREQIHKCDYEQGKIEEELVQQMIEGSKSMELRTKLLTSERTLDEAIEIGKAIEEVKVRINEYREQPTGIARLKAEKWSKRPQKKGSEEGRTCFDCGIKGHISKDQRCPALGQKCRRCGRLNHFERCCNKRKASEQNDQSNQAKKVKRVTEEPPTDVDTKDYFSFYTGAQDNRMSFKLGGIQITLFVDSGSDVSLLKTETWEWLREEGAIMGELVSGTKHKLNGIAKGSKLDVIGCFRATVEAGSEKVEENFYVANDAVDNLIGSAAAKRLRCLKVGLRVGKVRILGQAG